MNRTALLPLMCLVIAAAAHAEPGPRAPGPASTVARLASAAPDRLAAAAPRGLEAACGSRLERVVEIASEHLARPESEPLPTPHSTDIGEIAVLEDDGRFFYINKGGMVIADLAAIGQSFYRTHGDDYDCLAVYLSSGLSTWLGSPTAIAASFVVRNPTLGIGLDVFDLGGNFGSASRLQWMLSMNGLHRYPADPHADIAGDSFSAMDVLAHEFGHRWLAYVPVDSLGDTSWALLGRSYQHWSFFFDADSSYMEGCNWSNVAPDSFRTDGVSAVYGNLDLYLMGLRPGFATPPFFTLHDATDFDPPGVYVPYTGPFVGLGCRARAQAWTVADIEAANGPRVPDAASAPHVFRVGFVLVTARGEDATPADLAQLEVLRSAFPPTFTTATQGLGGLDATIDSRAGTVAIDHEPVKDRTDALGPVPLGARVAIAPGGIPIALDPGSVRVDFRFGTSGPFTSMPMAPAGPDSFVAHLPPPGTGGPVQYAIHAASDSAGIDASDPPAGNAAPHQFLVGPDLVPPVIVHVPIVEQGEGRLPVTLLARVTDNAELDSVLVQWGTGGATPLRALAVPVGRDSFAYSIGPGIPEGETVSYYFAARDASGNLSEHLEGSAPHGITVGRDWRLNFENGTEGTSHSPVWYSYRDAWHLTTEESSPPGGTAWKCGEGAPLPYPVHLDAVLNLPVVPGVEPGTLLRFDHRYALEEANSAFAWDGARLEARTSSGTWEPLEPQAGYSHAFLRNSNPFQYGAPCWSGSSGGWRSEAADLSAYAPGPVYLRFRLLADDFFGFDGWFVDRVVVDYPAPSTGVPVAAATFAASAPWPNPAGNSVHSNVTLPRSARIDWSLYDLAGRRVGQFARGLWPAGRHSLEATLPDGLGRGLYFLRLAVEGQATQSHRIALIR